MTEGPTRCIGIVSAGAMGGPVGRSLVGRGHRVVVALEGRSGPSVARAAEGGLEDLGTLDALVGAADLVVSIVPPAAAVEVAEKVAHFMAEDAARPAFLDANAISPMRAEQIASTIERAGGRYIDGGIVGGPPRHGQRTDLFVSGRESDALAIELTTPELVVTSIGEDPTAASSLKMCFAAWTKGTSALLITIRALARARGVEPALVELWGRTQASVLDRSESAGDVAARAWRWVDEMAEIAHSFDQAGLPDGAAVASARLYERLAGFKDRQAPVSLDEILIELLG